jgi:hypothetical protein
MSWQSFAAEVGPPGPILIVILSLLLIAQTADGIKYRIQAAAKIRSLERRLIHSFFDPARESTVECRHDVTGFEDGEQVAVPGEALADDDDDQPEDDEDTAVAERPLIELDSATVESAVIEYLSRRGYEFRPDGEMEWIDDGDEWSPENFALRVPVAMNLPAKSGEAS